MSTSTMTLGELRTESRYRADQINSQFVTDAELNSYINSSAYELYDLLTTAYGEDYHVATPYQFTTNGTDQLYPLPADFFKLLGVDLQLANTQDSFVTLKPFKFNERNKWAVPNIQTVWGATNLRYRINGDNLMFNLITAAGQNLRLWYVPQMTQLQVNFAANLVSSNPVISVSNTAQLFVGMSVGTITAGQIPVGATISSIVPNVSITLSAAPTVTANFQTIFAWNDATTVDGVSGWYEYIITDAAIKMMQKEESDVSVLAGQKMALIKRINDSASNRDVGESQNVSDTRSTFDDYPFTGNNGFGGSGAY